MYLSFTPRPRVAALFVSALPSARAKEGSSGSLCRSYSWLRFSSVPRLGRYRADGALVTVSSLHCDHLWLRLEAGSIPVPVFEFSVSQSISTA